MDFEDLSPELKEKAKACTSPEELKALAESEGFELTEDALQSVAGGAGLSSCVPYGCGSWSCSNDSCDDLDACYNYDCYRASCLLECSDNRCEEYHHTCLAKVCDILGNS